MPSGRPLRHWPAALALLALVTTPALAQTAAPTRVRVDTTAGSFTIELETARAPLTTANFLQYVSSGFYVGTIFHRVINGFVAQAGGYDDKYRPKTPNAPVPNESGNGLSNRRGTVGLARTEAPHSGNAQFYVNLADNEDLDPNPVRWGYAVFGRIVDGYETLDRIGHAATGPGGPFPKDVPVEPIVIRAVQVIAETPAPAAAPTPPAPASPPPP
jgi:cyclophilin family peptidyl-prolyl cis-trans isomerase